MRKIELVGSTVLLLIATAIPARAQSLPPDPGKWEVSLGGGATIPVGNTSDRLKTGIHGAINIGYILPNTHIELGAEGMYLRATNKTTAGDHSNIMVVTAHVHWGIGSALYVVTGIGLLRDEYKQPLTNITITNTHASLALEGGLGFDIGKIAFLEGRVIHSFRKDQDKYTLIPLTIGFRF